MYVRENAYEVDDHPPIFARRDFPRLHISFMAGDADDKVVMLRTFVSQRYVIREDSMLASIQGSQGDFEGRHKRV